MDESARSEDRRSRLLPNDATPEERREWERLVLAIAREAMLGPDAPSAPADKLVHSIELEAHYPETRIVVTLDDAAGRRRREAFGLWDDGFESGTSHRDDPESVVGIIIANLEEP
jgi:hypothetical protein